MARPFNQSRDGVEKSLYETNEVGSFAARQTTPGLETFIALSLVQLTFGPQNNGVSQGKNPRNDARNWRKLDLGPAHNNCVKLYGKCRWAAISPVQKLGCLHHVALFTKFNGLGKKKGYFISK